MVKTKEDLEFLIYLCDQRYAARENAWGYVLSKPTVERDLEIVRAYFGTKDSARAVGRRFALSGSRVQQIAETWRYGLTDPNVLRSMQERQGTFRETKAKAWNKRVAEITEITGD